MGEEGCAGGVPVSASAKDGMRDDIFPRPVDLIKRSGAVQPGRGDFLSDGKRRRAQCTDTLRIKAGWGGGSQKNAPGHGLGWTLFLGMLAQVLSAQ